MRSAAIALAAGTALVLAGCNTAAPPSAVPSPVDPRPGACDANAAAWARGERVAETTVEQARRDAGARLSRVVRPGQSVTMEFNPERLTIDVDRRERIADLRCG